MPMKETSEGPMMIADKVTDHLCDTCLFYIVDCKSKIIRWGMRHPACDNVIACDAYHSSLNLQEDDGE